MKVMIVEDEVLLAMELESEIQMAGHQVTGHAMSSTQARQQLERSRPDFAFVDIHLLDGPTGLDVGRELAAADVPYVFVSGNIKKIPEDFAGALGAIEKPYTMNGMKNALAYVSAFLAGEGGGSPPASLILSSRHQTEGPANAHKKPE